MTRLLLVGACFFLIMSSDLMHRSQNYSRPRPDLLGYVLLIHVLIGLGGVNTEKPTDCVDYLT